MWHRGVIVAVDTERKQAIMERNPMGCPPPGALRFAFDASHRDLARFIGRDVWIYLAGRTGLLYNLKEGNKSTRIDLLRIDAAFAEGSAL